MKKSVKRSLKKRFLTTPQKREYQKEYNIHYKAMGIEIEAAVSERAKVRNVFGHRQAFMGDYADDIV